MRTGRIGLISLAILAMLLFCAPWATAQVNHFAVATSPTALYLLWAEGGPTRSFVQIFNKGSVGLDGVATYGRWVFMADSSTNSLLIGELGNLLGTPTFTLRNTISLGSGSMHVEQPSAVAVDGQGGVYVIGKTWSDGGTFRSNYAYISSASGNYGDAVVTVGDLGRSPMADIAAFSHGGISSAIIAHQFDGSRTHVSFANGSGITGRIRAGEISDDYVPAYPSGTAVLTGLLDAPLAYVISRHNSTDADDLFGALDVIRTDTRTVIGSYSFGDGGRKGLNPQDVTTWTTGDGATKRHFLGIIGTPYDSTDGPAQAWKIELDGSGLPIWGTLQTAIWSGTDYSLFQQCAASSDGQVFWSVHPQQEMVIARQTSFWSQQIDQFDGQVHDSIKRIATYVPEPSSVLALASFAAGMAVFVRRRR